ncbi:MAG: Type 1 glutamine amidotransferase-like domain-containing protein [Candidatus Schekmanbacteria bacterium]|nr:Type 1 glutamine amidotransferase-like domain-containing protein [Candidatus Schekmanbacteria bacterium]
MTEASLFLIGGDDDSDALWALVARWAAQARSLQSLLVLMDEFPDHATWVPGFEARFRDLGFASVRSHLPEVRDQETPAALADMIRDADTVYVFGGCIERYCLHYVNAPVTAALCEHIARGRDYLGMSSGAMIAGGRVLLSNEELPFYPWFEDLRSHVTGLGDATIRTAGLGLLPRAIIDSHFNERRRQPRLFNALEHDLVATVGIGLDSAMAVHIRGTAVTCHGRGQAYVYIRGEAGIEGKFFRDGERFCLPEGALRHL